MQGRIYATKVMNMVFVQDTLCNKSAYAVTKLPSLYLPSYSEIDLECDEVKHSTMMKRILQFPTNHSSRSFDKFKFSSKKWKHGGVGSFSLCTRGTKKDRCRFHKKLYRTQERYCFV